MKFAVVLTSLILTGVFANAQEEATSASSSTSSSLESTKVEAPVEQENKEVKKMNRKAKNAKELIKHEEKVNK